MTIERVIDGNEYKIVLTPRELLSAYTEQQHEYDVTDIELYFDCFDDDDIMDFCGATRKDVEKLFDDMAYEMRRKIDKYEMSFEFARDEAIKDVIEENSSN